MCVFQVLLRPEVFDGMVLGTNGTEKFLAPNTAVLSYAGIVDYVLTNLPSESPPMFGLHPNAVRAWRCACRRCGALV